MELWGGRKNKKGGCVCIPGSPHYVSVGNSPRARQSLGGQQGLHIHYSLVVHNAHNIYLASYNTQIFCSQNSNTRQ